VRNLWHIFQLGLKEMVSLWRDPVLLFLIAYSFTFSIYTPAKSAVMDVVNASIAVVDEDDSQAARAIREAFLPPLFLPAAQIDFKDINREMDSGKYTFVVNIPPRFQSDLERDAKPTVQIVTDATARGWISTAAHGQFLRALVLLPTAAVADATIDALAPRPGEPLRIPVATTSLRASVRVSMTLGVPARPM